MRIGRHPHQVLQPWQHAGTWLHAFDHGAVVVAAEAIHGDEAGHFRMRQGVLHLARRGPGVQAHRDRAELLQREEGKHPLDAVAHEDRHMVVALHAQRHQAFGRAPHLLAQRAVAQSLRACNEGLAVAKLCSLLVKKRGNRSTGWHFVHVGVFPAE